MSRGLTNITMMKLPVGLEPPTSGAVTRKTPISSIVVYDKMNDWGGVVYGVTLGTGRPEPAKAAQKKSTPAKSIAEGPARINITAKNVVLESPAYRIGIA